MTTQLENKAGLSEDLQLKLDEANRLFNSANYAQAINNYKEIVKAEPEFVPALNMLASCCIKVNSEDDAIAILRRIIAIKPNRQSAHARLARLLSKQEAFPEAIKEYKAAISLDVDQPDWVFMGLGRALREIKKDSSTEN